MIDCDQNAGDSPSASAASSGASRPGTSSRAQAHSATQLNAPNSALNRCTR